MSKWRSFQRLSLFFKPVIPYSIQTHAGRAYISCSLGTLDTSLKNGMLASSSAGCLKCTPCREQIECRRVNVVTNSRNSLRQISGPTPVPPEYVAFERNRSWKSLPSSAVAEADQCLTQPDTEVNCRKERRALSPDVP